MKRRSRIKAQRTIRDLHSLDQLLSADDVAPEFIGTPPVIATNAPPRGGPTESEAPNEPQDLRLPIRARSD